MLKKASGSDEFHGGQALGLLKTTLHFINQHLLKLSWLALLVLFMLLFFGSWLLMFLAGESALITPETWFYYFVTTATTVGYGDFSPQTSGGRLTASLLVMPGGVVVFAGILGKLSSFFVELWRKNMKGKGDYSALSGHIVILGWHPERTPRMVRLIFGDTRREDRKVVLCATEEMDNPLPDQVLFIQGESLSDDELLRRAGVESADRVIIYRSTDDKTLTSCLTVAALSETAHIVAWFEQEHMVKLLKSHCPEVECHTSISMELLVRSAQDPGSSRVQGQLLSTLIGPTQYSVRVPENFTGVTFSRLLEFLKNRHEAIALGVAETVTGDDLVLNPEGDRLVKGGQLVYYMSAQRIRTEEIQWRDIEM
ncbi:ion channel [Endozoicomonas arenosclerae]|uniref:ion channel n=1 Tax=Endozoicomonas arenosclerae TaxID=1633495 RepID=UPI000AB4D9F9|nr:ion channel [Endozoicomonas arenosclerae]